MCDEEEYSRERKRVRKKYYLSTAFPEEFGPVELSESSVSISEVSLSECSSFNLTVIQGPSLNERSTSKATDTIEPIPTSESTVSRNPTSSALSLPTEGEIILPVSNVELHHALIPSETGNKTASQVEFCHISSETCEVVKPETVLVCHNEWEAAIILESQEASHIPAPIYSSESFVSEFQIDFTYDYPAPNVEEELHVVDHSLLDDASLDFDVTPVDSSSLHKNQPIYEGSSVNLWESLTALLTLTQSDKLSGATLARIISVIDLHLPQPNNFFRSTHALYKLLEKQKEPVDVSYFCSNCYKSRPSISDLCDVCTDDARTVNYFITLPLTPQVQKLYASPDFVQNIKYKSTRIKENDANVEDIYDGELYKGAESSFLTSDTDLTFTWNTDGLQVYKSTSYSLWPWYLVVNELPPEKRYLSENMLIGGIWGSVVKPHPNVYLKNIFNELKRLERGIDVKFYGSEVTHKIKCFLLCGTCDAPARASFLNMKSHSGFYSCPVCLCRGERYENTTVFPFEEDFPPRTPQQYEISLQRAVHNRVLFNNDPKKEEDCLGIRGPTLLSGLVDNPFLSTAVDSMHCVYLGVTRQMIHLWFDKELKDEDFSMFDQIKTVSKRLLEMTPPHFVERAAQSVEKLCHWKASELRTFLLYYCLCIVSNILNPEYFDHLVKFVKGVSLLNKSSISAAVIQLASLLLREFVSDFERLYGRRNMSHNLHMLLHLGDCVKRLGPLFITSCFKFEDMNGRLCNLIHGTRHAGLQVHSNLSVISNLSRMVHGLREGPAKDFCTKIRNKWMRLRITEKISEGVYCVGDMSSISSTNEWILDQLVDNGIFPPDKESVLIFHRLLKDKMLHVSANYDRGKRVSSVINYSESSVDKIGNIEYFVKVKFDTSVSYYAVVQYLSVNTEFSCDHIFSGTPSGFIEIVRVCDLGSIMYRVPVGTKEFYCDVLNKFELE